MENVDQSLILASYWTTPPCYCTHQQEGKKKKMVEPPKAILTCGAHEAGNRKARDIVDHGMQQRKVTTACRSLDRGRNRLRRVQKGWEKKRIGGVDRSMRGVKFCCQYKSSIAEAVIQGNGLQLQELHKQVPVPSWQNGRVLLPPNGMSFSESSQHSSKRIDGGSTVIQTRFDAIIIPSGGIDNRGFPNPWTRERLDAAVELESSARYFVCLSRATPHKTPLYGRNNRPLDEAQCMARYLAEEKDIPRTRILCECWSVDTIGNAFACRQLLCEPLRLLRLVVINSNFHMPRTRIIFDWIFNLRKEGCSCFNLFYLAVNDQGLTEQQVKARIMKEEESMRVLTNRRIPELKASLSAVTRFLFVEHAQHAALLFSKDLPSTPSQGPFKSDASSCSEDENETVCSADTLLQEQQSWDELVVASY